MSYYPREAWEQEGYTVAEHTGSPSPYWHLIDTVVIHYPGCESCVPAGSNVQANLDLMANTQKYYADVKGYSVGYNWKVTKAGDVIEGRGADFMNAANYSRYKDRNENAYSMSIQIMVNGLGEQAEMANAAQVAAVNDLIRVVETRAGRPVEVVGHKDTKPTSCPGVPIYSQIQNGTFKSSKKDNVVVNNMTFVVPPRRLIDTRETGKPSAGYMLSVDTGEPGLAAKVNVTAVGADGVGHVRADASDASGVHTSCLNFQAGEAICNQIDVPVVNGKFTLWISASTHIIVDLVAMHS